MQIAIVGCGYVADFYLKTLSCHPELELVGVMDIDESRASHFASYHSIPMYNSFEELLSDPKVDIVINLTNPRSHYSISMESLRAGKHVYSEKPLAMDFLEAKMLVSFAEENGLYLSSAPCTLLGETAQTAWKTLRANEIGTVYCVYAELDDGLVHQMPYRKWRSESGIPWPYKDEFEVGCTIEHSAYAITWLAAFFGPVESVTAFSSCLIPDKETDVPLDVISPDYSVANIKFRSGVVGRITTSIVGPHNHALQIIGENGILFVNDLWNEWSKVQIGRRFSIRRRTFESPWKTNVPLVGSKRPSFRYRGSQKIDFSRGISELAEAISQKKICRLSARFCLHINEVVLAIHNAGEVGKPYRTTTTFDPIEPMPWAMD
jgi:predicted dehydrogenase